MERRGAVQNGNADNGHAQNFLLSEVIGWKVRTKAGAKLGKLKDFVARDDPKYAEVTAAHRGTTLRRPFAEDPLERSRRVRTEEIIVQNPPEGSYAEIGPDEDLLLLRDKILDKRVLDTTGSAVEVVYDISASAWWRTSSSLSPRTSAGTPSCGDSASAGSSGGHPKDAGAEGFIPWKYVQPLAPDLTPTKGDVRLTVAKNRLGEIHPEDLGGHTGRAWT